MQGEMMVGKRKREEMTMINYAAALRRIEIEI
jgi:hypothetical protein